LERFGEDAIEVSLLGILCLLSLLLVACGSLSGSAAAAQSRETSTVSNGPIAFEIPAQKLESAIEAYSVISEWQVIYDAGLAVGRRSTAVRGRLPPAAALTLLLSGTGLTAEFMTADGVMLVPERPAQYVSQLEARSPAGDYYGRIQAGLRREFCAEELIRSNVNRIALGFWIGGSGAVTRVAPLGSTGDTATDAAFSSVVARLAVGEAPPPGFKQPVVILVTPDLIAQCSVPRAVPARTAQ
jgi:hypothetical protein